MDCFNGQQDTDGHAETLQVAHAVGMKDFELLHVLGFGASAQVFLVRKLTGPDTGKLYALKQIPKTFALEYPARTRHTLTERRILELVRDDPLFTTMQYAFQTDCMLNLVLEYEHGGELFEQITRRTFFPEADAKMYLAELVLALEKLHDLGFAYRDLKPENILLDASGHIKLADFGLCKDFRNCKVRRTTSFCGSLFYLAPEQAAETGHNHMADWWALGIVAFEFLTGDTPFYSPVLSENTSEEMMQRIQDDEPRECPLHFSSAMKQFIGDLLVKDPRERLGAGGAHEIKEHQLFEGVNWTDVAERTLVMPFIPSPESASDLSNFCEDFLARPVTEAVCAVPTEGNDAFREYAFSPPTNTPHPDTTIPLSGNSLDDTTTPTTDTTSDSTTTPFNDTTLTDVTYNTINTVSAYATIYTTDDSSDDTTTPTTDTTSDSTTISIDDTTLTDVTYNTINTVSAYATIYTTDSSDDTPTHTTDSSDDTSTPTTDSSDDTTTPTTDSSDDTSTPTTDNFLADFTCNTINTISAYAAIYTTDDSSDDTTAHTSDNVLTDITGNTISAYVTINTTDDTTTPSSDRSDDTAISTTDDVLPDVTSYSINTISAYVTIYTTDDTTTPTTDSSDDTTLPTTDSSDDTTAPSTDSSDDTTLPSTDSSDDTTAPSTDSSDDTTTPTTDNFLADVTCNTINTISTYAAIYTTDDSSDDTNTHTTDDILADITGNTINGSRSACTPKPLKRRRFRRNKISKRAKVEVIQNPSVYQEDPCFLRYAALGYTDVRV